VECGSLAAAFLIDSRDSTSVEAHWAVLGMGHGVGSGLLRHVDSCGTVLSAAEKRPTKLWSSPTFFYLES
jgi:hypothetical protein